LVFVVAVAPFILALMLIFLAKPLSAFLVDLIIHNQKRPDERRLFGILEIQSWIGGLLFLILGLLLLPDAFDVEIPGWQLVAFGGMLVLVVCLTLAARPVVNRSSRWGTYALAVGDSLAILSCIAIYCGYIGTHRNDTLAADEVLTGVQIVHPPNVPRQEYFVSGRLRGPSSSLAGRVPWVANRHESSGADLRNIPPEAIAQDPCHLDQSGDWKCSPVNLGQENQSGKYYVWVFLASSDQIRSIIHRERITIDSRDALRPIEVSRT
jgi:hypothetical protein